MQLNFWQKKINKTSHNTIELCKCAEHTQVRVCILYTLNEKLLHFFKSHQKI